MTQLDIWVICHYHCVDLNLNGYSKIDWTFHLRWMSDNFNSGYIILYIYIHTILYIYIYIYIHRIYIYTYTYIQYRLNAKQHTHKTYIYIHIYYGKPIPVTVTTKRTTRKTTRESKKKVGYFSKSAGFEKASLLELPIFSGLHEVTSIILEAWCGILKISYIYIYIYIHMYLHIYI